MSQTRAERSQPADPNGVERKLQGLGLQLELRRSKRSRHIRVEVHRSRTVRLIIPDGVQTAIAMDFLESRLPWVADHADALARQEAPAIAPLRWDGQSSIPLLGENRQINRRPSLRKTPRVEDDGTTLWLCGPPTLFTDERRCRQALEAWLRRRCEQESSRLLDEEAQRLGVSWRSLRLGDMRSRWGSCGPTGGISLNWRLIMAPPEVLRYVIVHELCHRCHMDHSPRFWALVEHQMPDYPQARDWLKQQGHSLHLHLPAAR